MRDVCLFKRGVCVAIALMSGVLVACTHKNYPAFDQQQEADLARQLYEPLVAGQAEVVANLPHAETHPVLFHLEEGDAKRVEGDFAETDLWQENNVVFYVQGGDEKNVWYFCPREMRLSKIGQEESPSPDLLSSEAGHFIVYRALPISHKPNLLRNELDLFRLEFCLNEKGEVTFVSGTRITKEPSNITLPLVLPDRREVVFLAEENQVEDEKEAGQPEAIRMHRNHRLYVCDEFGKNPKPYFETQKFDIRYPRLDTQAGLVFAANPEGDYRLYGLNSEGGLKPFEGVLPKPEGADELFFGTTYEKGATHPALLQLPPELDLKTVATLVLAHNAEINRKRALLAAALIEAGYAKLANYPTVTLGINYTPVTDFLVPEPKTTSGDFLAEGLIRGMIGIVQPLLDFPRNARLGEAARWRAQIATQALNNEINERIAEGAAIYFETLYYQHLVELQAQMGEVTQRRLDYYQKLRTHGDATRAQMLAVASVMANLKSEGDYYAGRLAFLQSRLRNLCGLSSRIRPRLKSEAYILNEFSPPPLETMRERALLNHPQMRAAEAALSRAFYLHEAGPDIRPSLAVSSTYGHSRRIGTMNPVDEYVSLALNGNLPTAMFEAQDLHKAYWGAIFNSLEIDQEAQARALAISLEEVRLDFTAAQADLGAKIASQKYTLEKLRIARLHQEHGDPSIEKTDPLEAMTARFDYLAAVIKTEKVRMDLGLRYGKLWREMGLAYRLPDEIAPYSLSQHRKNSRAVWVWNSGELLLDNKVQDQFFVLAKKVKIHRVYLYFKADAGLLDDTLLRERLMLFLQECAGCPIEVFALLGEPEWLTEKTPDPLLSSVKKIMAFNKDILPFEPKIVGIKVDLEPHSVAGWVENAEIREKLNARYLSLLSKAKTEMADTLPLWVDVPVKFFRPEHRAFLDTLVKLVDGMTLMDYCDQEATLLKNAGDALEVAGCPLEIGIELSKKAPAGDTLAGWSEVRLEALLKELTTQFGNVPCFEGVSIHDEEALAAFFEGKNAK